MKIGLSWVKYILKVFVLIVSLNASQSFAQLMPNQGRVQDVRFVCGFKSDLTHPNLPLSKATELINKQNVTTNIPIKFHIVRQSDGTGGLTLSNVAAELVKINSKFALGNINFFECEAPEFINSDEYNDLEAYGAEDIAMSQAYDLINVLNIYFVDQITISGTTNTLCGYAYSPYDFVVVRNSCTTNGNLTTSHEIGHYFSLKHTQTLLGNPQELVNGSNCSTAGDYVCDTPAEPPTDFSLPAPVDNNCNYIGTALDPNNQPYTPLTNNIMSSNTPGYCWTSFTVGQMARVHSSILNDKNHLQCSNPVSISQLNNISYEFNTIINNEELIVTCQKEFSRIKLIDINGKSIKTIDTSNQSATTTKSINIAEVANGVYLVQLFFEDRGFVSKKVFINR